jgi:putative acetyltransferase
MNGTAADLESEPLGVRRETATDHDAVDALVAAAFEGRAEADAVAALRSSPDVVSLVAVERGEVIGHVLISPVTVGAAARAPGLAPLAVRPDRQGRGVGTALVRAVLELCRTRRDAAVFVLGDPAYYERFGFVDATLFGLRYREPVVPGAFQVCMLSSELPAGWSGEVRYHPVFDGL